MAKGKEERNTLGDLNSQVVREQEKKANENFEKKKEKAKQRLKKVRGEKEN